MPKARTKTKTADNLPVVSETRGDLPSGGLTPLQLKAISGDYGFATPGGLTVNERTSLTLPAVWSCVDLISSTIASLDHHVYKRMDNGGKLLSMSHPVEETINLWNHIEDNKFKYWRTAIAQVLTFGASFAEIERDEKGEAFNLHLLDPRDVEIKRLPKDQDYQVVYRLRHHHNKRDLLPCDVLHLNCMGYYTLEGMSPVRTACSAIGIGIGAQKFVEQYLSNGIQPTGIIEMDARVNHVGALNTKEQIQEKQGGVWNAGQLLMLPPGYKFNKTQTTFVDAQMAETRKFVIREVARVFRCPLSLLGESEHSYNSSEEANRQWVDTCIGPWLSSIEAEIHKKLFRKQDRFRYFTEFRLDRLLKGNHAQRAEYFTKLFNMGAITPNQVCMAEGFNPYEGGDFHYLPVNNLSPIEKQPPVDNEPDDVAPDVDNDLFRSVEGIVWQELGRVIRRGVKQREKDNAKTHLAKLTLDGMAGLMGLVNQFNRGITADRIANLVVDAVERISDPASIGDWQKELTSLILGRANTYAVMLLVKEAE